MSIGEVLAFVPKSSKLPVKTTRQTLQAERVIAVSCGVENSIRDDRRYDFFELHRLSSLDLETSMAFLSGSLGFERFNVNGFNAKKFTDKHIEVLQNAAAGQFEMTAEENIQVGFLGGEHLFDQSFDLGKNIIDGALHCSIRIDSNQIPNAIRKAWMAMELAAVAGDNESGRPTKSQKQEAKEAVDARCREEAATGKYRKMAQFPVLWDLPNHTLYFGGSGAAAIGHCADLFERTFNVELSGKTAGSVALDWATENDQVDRLEDLSPVTFAPDQKLPDVSWSNPCSPYSDFLGNEFLLWLWWQLETETDTFALSDESEVTAMLTKTLTLECPLGEYGKETITSDSPIQLPEAIQAIRNGKLPRKTGMTLVRFAQQFDLVLAAETFAMSGVKIHLDEDADPHDLDARIQSIRDLCEAVDLLFTSFIELRVVDNWKKTQNKMTKWLADSELKRRKPAA